MIDKFFNYFHQQLRCLTLWGYGWKRRKTIVLSKPVQQWQDPITGLWYQENTAVRLLKVNVLDCYKHK